MMILIMRKEDENRCDDKHDVVFLEAVISYVQV